MLCRVCDTPTIKHANNRSKEGQLVGAFIASGSGESDLAAITPSGSGENKKANEYSQSGEYIAK